MNYAQFGLFMIYALSVLAAGIGIYSFLDKDRQSIMNGSVYLGESLLLGSILVAGELLIFSLLGLYKASFLWAIISLNFIFLANKDARAMLYLTVFKKIKFDLPLAVFILLLLVFVFRNCFFLVDIDSHTSYLFTQKLWLSAGTSLTGDIGTNIMVFFPQFDTIAYSLGLSLFGQETLFPQLINIFWRLIAVILIFGYTSFRFNRYYGLAAALLVILNDHFFYSGVNRWVIINAAVVGFLFAAAYNFWESRQRDNSFRFVLAVIFAGQLLANKYQMIYAAFLLVVFGAIFQPGPLKTIKGVMYNKRMLIAIIVSFSLVCLWYIKNMLITGVPTFPILAGRLRAFSWTPGQEQIFIKVFGGLKPSLFFKYMNYLFIWPGINAAKYVILTISSLPILLYVAIARRKTEVSLIAELCFWLAITILLVMGTCLASHWDPRYYRYSIGVFSFTAILSIRFILRYTLNIRNRFILAAIIIFLALRGGSNEGLKVIFSQGGFFNTPTFKENTAVLLNRLHMDSVINEYYPQVPAILNIVEKNREKLNKAAWDMGSAVNFPLFLLPVRPTISLWRSTLIRWDSFNKKEKIADDLKKYGIEWVITTKNNEPVFISANDYAADAKKYDLHPQKIMFDYEFPPELTRIQY